MKTRWKLAIMFVTILIMIVAVFLFARVMSPIQEGHSSIFWANACGVSIKGGRGIPMSGFSAGIHPARDGWFIYYIQGYHGQRLYRVSHSEVVADFPRAIQLIEEAAGRENARKIILDAYVVIEENRAEIEEDPAKFLSLLRDYRMAELRESDPDRYLSRISYERDFDLRWERVNRFWVNIAFECALFSGLALFAFWPWLRGKPKWRICLNLGLLPLLLFIPHYLGYSGWTFTSAGPSGGALYPLVIFLFHPLIVSWTPVDIWIIESLPHLLEPISQPLGPMLSISGGGTLPPVSGLYLGAAIFWAAWFAPGLFRRARSALNRLPGGGRRKGKTSETKNVLEKDPGE